MPDVMKFSADFSQLLYEMRCKMTLTFDPQNLNRMLLNRNDINTGKNI